MSEVQTPPGHYKLFSYMNRNATFLKIIQNERFSVVSDGLNTIFMFCCINQCTAEPQGVVFSCVSLLQKGSGFRLVGQLVAFEFVCSQTDMLLG